MNKKSFIWGVVTGIVLTIVGLIVIGSCKHSFDPVEYLEQPVSYENKTVSSFEVLQVIGDAALAREESNRIGDEVLYLGNTVLILGDKFYTDQVVTIKNPQRVGTYSYTNKGGMPMTVPVLDGEIQ